MTKTHLIDLANSSTSENQQLPTHAAAPVDQLKLLEDIMYLETQIEVLHSDYQLMTESIEHQTQNKIPENISKTLPNLPWHQKAALKIAHLLVDSPKPKSIPVQASDYSVEEKKHLATQALQIQKKLERLTAERDEKMTLLDLETRHELEAKSNVTNIRDFIAKKSHRILQIVGQEQMQSTKGICVASKDEMDKFAGKLKKIRGINGKDREKIILMISKYKESIETAQDIDPNVEIKSLEEITAAFLNQDVELIREIAKFHQPTLVITPKNSFESKIANMNRRKKYDSASGETQEDAFVMANEKGPFQTITTPTKTVVSVVDAQPHMPHIKGITADSRWDDRKAALQSYFAAKKIGLMNIHQAPVLEQHCLRAYKEHNKNIKKIIDYCDGSNEDTFSCFSDEYLTNSDFVAFSCFYSNYRRLYFGARDPDTLNARLRGRPSVQFLEY